MDAISVDIGAVDPRDGLQQDVIAHGLVEIHAVEDRRIVAGEEFVGDNQNLRLFGRLFEQEADIRLSLI